MTLYVEPDPDDKPERFVDRFTVNDTLTGILSDHGSALADDDLNELTHQVSDLIDKAMHGDPKKEA